MSVVMTGGGRIPPPDGGYGWVICAACFFCAAVVDGIPTAFGIILEPIANELKSPRSAVATVPSLLWGTIEGVGPLACLMVNRLGLRITSLVGTVVCAGAFATASLATEVWMLVLTFGVMAGSTSESEVLCFTPDEYQCLLPFGVCH